MRTRASEASATPWRLGPFKHAKGLIFGTMYEDPSIELRSFKPRSRVFSIASAGCVARALAAAGHSVTAVDINPQQIAYAESRAAGGSPRTGSVDRLMEFGRTVAKLFGWNRRTLLEFLELSDPHEQLAYWDRHLDTRRWRLALDTLLAPRLLGSCYSGPFIQSLPRDFGRRMRHRLRRGWAQHANKDNPYAALLLLGKQPAGSRSLETPVSFVCADAADFLESRPPATFDALALSNIGDGAPPEYLRRLSAAIEHAAVPQAVIVTRSFAEPKDCTLENLATQDRSLLWGTVRVSRVERGGLCSIF